jgi:hypothetical protein
MNELLVSKLNNINNSKYIYRNNESEHEIIIFEIKIIQFNKNNNKLRLITKSRNGELISYNNKIKYNNINKIIINAININNNKIININCFIDQYNNKSIFSNDYINTKIYNKNNFLIVKYELINI